jgi:hypothetical protein
MCDRGLVVCHIRIAGLFWQGFYLAVIHKNINKGVGRFFAHEVLMPGGSGWRSPGPMRESFFAQGRAYTELRRIEQFCETGNFDAIPTAPTSNSQLSIAVANGPLSSSAYAVLMAEAIRTA